MNDTLFTDAEKERILLREQVDYSSSMAALLANEIADCHILLTAAGIPASNELDGRISYLLKRLEKLERIENENKSRD